MADLGGDRETTARATATRRASAKAYFAYDDDNWHNHTGRALKDLVRDDRVEKGARIRAELRSGP
jgi:hypothetical protein